MVGIVGNHDFLIGDTLADRPEIRFDEIPRFAPECFAHLHNRSTAKFKRFREGLEQLLKEGLAQSFLQPDSHQYLPLLGAVGPLQFEVLQYRLESEYGAECRVEMAPWKVIRWVRPPEELARQSPRLKPNVPGDSCLAVDTSGCQVVLLPDAWAVKSLETRNKDWQIEPRPLSRLVASPGGSDSRPDPCL